jgi:hypothetical protein
MFERGISSYQIEETLLNPDFRLSTSQQSLESKKKFADNRTLKVWTVGGFPFDKTIVVKSAAWED